MTHYLTIGVSNPDTVSLAPLSNFLTQRCCWHKEQRDIGFHNNDVAVGETDIVTVHYQTSRLRSPILRVLER